MDTTDYFGPTPEFDTTAIKYDANQRSFSISDNHDDNYWIYTMDEIGLDVSVVEVVGNPQIGNTSAYE